MDLRFLDRCRAGQLLAQQLSHLIEPEPGPELGIVLALPRGGVPVAYEIACSFNWPLDVWLVRKLGVPDQPELAMGAIALPHSQVLNKKLIEKLQIADAQVDAVVRSELQELHRRNQCYRREKPLPHLAGKPIILVDDGLATGATMQVAIMAISSQRPARITVAVPIAASSSLKRIASQVDKVVCPLTPHSMGAISQWYVHFEPVTDEEVVALLERTESLPQEKSG